MSSPRNSSQVGVKTLSPTTISFAFTHNTLPSSDIVAIFVSDAIQTNGENPNALNGEKPNALNGEKPNAPNGEKPNAPNGEKPKAPNGEKPKAPNGEKPKAPNGAKENVVVTLPEAGEVAEFPFGLIAYTVYV